MFNKTSTTSIVAVILTVGALAFFFCAHFFESKATDTTETQIVQGLFGALMLAIGYYFGQSKYRAGSGPAGPTIGNAEEVNVTNPPVDNSTGT